MNLIALYWAMLLLEAEPGPVSFADNSFTLVPLRAEDLSPERAVQMALDFLRAVDLSVQEPPGLMELGQWRSYGWRIPRMWRLGWGPPHWPRTIEITFNALSGELILYNNEDAEYYTCQACRRGDPPQIGSQRALELAQYYLKASGGVSVPMVFKGLYRSVGGYSSGSGSGPAGPGGLAGGRCWGGPEATYRACGRWKSSVGRWKGLVPSRA